MWLLEGVDQASSNALDAYGIRPRTGEGLVGVFVAPWLHGGWAHLVSNTFPFFVLGILVLLDGWRQLVRRHPDRRTDVSGAAVWLLAPTELDHPRAPAASCSAGSTYLRGARLLHRQRLARSPSGVVVFLLYGGMLWGVLPTDVGVSWQAHLGGALGGLLAARSRGRAGRPRPHDARAR